jgi:hypothetical protein
MRQNTTITSPNETLKLHTLKITIAVLTLILVGGGYCYSQSNNTGNTMKTTKNTAPVYLDKNDPIFKSIKNRAVTDLQTSAARSAPDSPGNNLLATKIKTWSEADRKKLQAFGEAAITDYATQTHFDAETFVLVFDAFGKMDQKKMSGEYDIRVQNIGDDNFVAEFWEDGLAVNSEANAVVYAQELANSGYAKKHPDSDVGNVEVIKNNYAHTRKSINAGKQERYTKMMALLYTVGKDGLVTFHDPGQSMIDYVKKNSK